MLDCRERYKRYKNLYIELIESITSLKVDLEQLMPIIALLLCEVGCADRSAIILFDESKQTGFIKTGFNVINNQFENDKDKRIHLENYPEIKEVIKEKKVLILNNEKEILRYLPQVRIGKANSGQYIIKAILICPIIIDCEIIGVIRIDKVLLDKTFDENDELICKIISEQLTLQFLLEKNRLIDENKTFSEKIINSMIDSFIIINPDISIRVVNQATIKLLGYCEKELIGKSLNMVLKKSELITRLNQNESIEQVEIIYKTKSQAEIPVLFSGSPIFDDDGYIQGYICIAKNISEIKELEKQLVQAQKMEAIGSLAGGIAHDFNNILTIIRSYTELLEESLKINHLPPLTIKEIITAVDRASSLTKQLLAFSRKEILQTETTDVNQLINDLLIMLKRLIGEDVKLNIFLSQCLGKVKVDCGKIEQVILNLVINARDVMPEGGHITIKTSMQTIIKKYQAQLNDQFDDSKKEGKFIVISIEDNGPGIDEADLPYIFEPFFTTKKGGKGTGLGLSVAYGIIQQHNGWIEVKSRPEKGTIFNLFLPVVSEEVKTKTTFKKESINLLGKGEKILIVEDDVEILRFTQKVLSSRGFRIFTADNVKDALEIFEQQKDQLQLIFCDVILPDKSGLYLYEIIKKIRSDIIIVLWSGYTDDKMQRSIIQEKNIPFIQKPFSLQQIMQVIDQSLYAKKNV